MAQDIFERMCNDVLEWINHSSEGYRRTEEDLIHFDMLWDYLSNMIIDFQSRDILSIEEQDFIKMIKYEGQLRRVHKKYDKKKPHFGIKETTHYNSWTKTENLLDLHKVYNETNYLILVAETKPDMFGIDLNGFSEFIKKYIYPNYSIGSPAIYKEQEVVFPILFSTISDMKIVKLGGGYQ